MNTNELKRLLSSYRLSADERASLRARIVATMESLPAVRNREELRLPLQGAHTWASLIKTSFTTPLSYRYLMTIVLLLALLAGGGTSLAAEQALPGDALYPVKVDIMEPIRATLAVSPEAKAKWQTRVAERRLEEGERLLASGSLSDENRAKIEAGFEIAASSARARIEAVRQSDSAAAAFIDSDFETSLKTHGFIITQLGASEGRDREEFQSLHIVIERQFRESSDDRDPDANDAKTRKRAEDRRTLAERKLGEALRAIERYRAVINTEVSSAITLRIESARQSMASGTSAFAAGNYDIAFASFTSAHGAAQDAQAMATAAYRLQETFNKRDTVRIQYEKNPDDDGRDDSENDNERNSRKYAPDSSSTDSVPPTRKESRDDDDRGDEERQREERGEKSYEGEDDADEWRGKATRPTSTPATTTPPSSGPTIPNPSAGYTRAQVALHASAASCWTIVQGSVYDVTGWILQHPGGASAITSLCGVDGSAAFSGQHGGEARPAQELARFKIGILAP